MSGNKPSNGGTLFFAVMGGISLVDAGKAVVQHATSGGFTRLELGIVVSLALIGAVFIVLGVLTKPAPSPPATGGLPGWVVALGAAIGVLSLLATRDLLPQYTVFRGDARMIHLWRSSWDFLSGGALMGYAVFRQRLAWTLGHALVPGPAQ